MVIFTIKPSGVNKQLPDLISTNCLLLFFLCDLEFAYKVILNSSLFLIESLKLLENTLGRRQPSLIYFC